MSALPAFSDPESDRNRVFSRAKQALNKVGAKKKSTSSHLRAVKSEDKPDTYEAIEAMNRLHAANDNAMGSHESPPFAGPSGGDGNQTINQSAQRPTPNAQRPGAMGPQRLAPTLGTAALELNRQQAEARLAEESQTETTAHATADLPIEGGRVFLELKPERPFETEEQREQQRQQAMLDVRRQFISPETPTTPAAETIEEPSFAEEPTGPEARQRQQAQAKQTYTAQMIEQAAELQADQAATKRALEEQARTAAKSAAASAGAAMEDFRFKQQIIRIGTQFAASPSIATFFTGLIDLNVTGFKLFVGSKVDVPFLYTKTTKPHTGFLFAVLFFDAMIFISPFIITGMTIAVVITLVYATVKFDIFQVIYGIYSALIS